MSPAIYLIICHVLYGFGNAKEAAEQVEKIAKRKQRARWKA